MRRKVTELGINPVKLLLRPFLRLALIGLIMLLVLLVAQTLLGGVVLVFLCLACAAIFLYLLIDSGSDLALAFYNLRAFHTNSRLVAGGGINIEWVLRDDSFNGVIGVDETNRLMLVNGRIYSFAEILMVAQDFSTIQITLREADTLPLMVGMPSASAAELGALRLMGVLDATPVFVEAT